MNYLESSGLAVLTHHVAPAMPTLHLPRSQGAGLDCSFVDGVPLPCPRLSGRRPCAQCFGLSFREYFLRAR